MRGRATSVENRAAVRRCLAEYGLTRRETADRLGLSFSTVARYGVGLARPGNRWKRPDLLLYLDSEGWSRQRIAAELNLSSGAVYAALKRARANAETRA
jgi:predicted transcriptional regulator